MGLGPDGVFRIFLSLPCLLGVRNETHNRIEAPEAAKTVWVRQVWANEVSKDVHALTKVGPMFPGCKCAVSTEDGLAFG